MESIFNLIVVIVIALLVYRLKINKKVKFIILIALVLCPIVFYFLSFKFSNDDGYGDRFEPIKEEIDKINNYEKATQLILKSLNEKDFDSLFINDNELVENFIKELDQRDLHSIQKDSLKLRFISSDYYVSIEGKDTTVKFLPAAGDFNMFSNDNSNELKEIPPYSIYKHHIIYTTKPIEKGENVTKIKDKFYYFIHEYDEY